MRKGVVLAVLAFTLISITSAGAATPDRFNAYLWPTLGRAAKSNWFEWWYTKVVDPNTGRAFFMIYGVVNPWDTEGTKNTTRAYVAFGDFSNKMQVETRFPVTEFQASQTDYDVMIGSPGVATADTAGIHGHLTEISNGAPQDVSWDLSYEDPWPFSAMGWAMGIPGFLNIGWYPAQASATMSGTIHINGETIVLNHAPAYQDRNWGSSFPKWWAWVVSNHFDNNDGAVFAAGGGAPSILGVPSPYRGMSMGLKYEGEVYSFCPTSGIFPKTDISFGKWEMSAQDRNGNAIEASATAPKESFMDLQFQAPSGETFHDYETLTGQLSIKLTRPGKDPVELHSSMTGIEYGSF